MENLAGRTFKYFIVWRQGQKFENKEVWECLCDCGRIFEMLEERIRQAVQPIYTTWSCGECGIYWGKGKTIERIHFLLKQPDKGLCISG